MNKKIRNFIWFTLMVCCIFSLGTGVYASGKTNEKDMGFPEELIISGIPEFEGYIYNVDQIEDSAELIIKGRFLPDSINIVKESAIDGFVGSQGFTLSKVEVTEVFYGNAKAGDTIGLVEYCYFDRVGGAPGDGQLCLITYSGYLPSIIGREYILFLKQEHTKDERDGLYSTHYTIYGRHLVPEQSDLSTISGNIDLDSISN